MNKLRLPSKRVNFFRTRQVVSLVSLVSSVSVVSVVSLVSRNFKMKRGSIGIRNKDNKMIQAPIGAAQKGRS